MENQQKTAVVIDQQIRFSDIAKQVITPDRIVPTIELAKGKRVLNIGCCGSDACTAELTVHRQIANVSSYCAGIDIFEEGIKKMQSDGENVRVASAEDFDLNEKFDVVIMGELIEHVSNPGRVFDMANRHLVDNGVIAVTTPNPFAFTLIVKQLMGKPMVVNTEHICWFDPVLLSFLLERSGFKPEQIFWTDASKYAPIRWLQKRRKDLHTTFGIIARKVADVD